MNITIIGTGFVGVVSAAVYASHGHTVTGLDIDSSKIAQLNQGKVPFYEPGLSELINQHLAKNLNFTTEYAEAIPSNELIIIAVGTPSASDGTADLTYVKAAAKSLAPHLAENSIVAIKSTVPPGTLDHLQPIIAKHTSARFTLASLPEFLREGKAVNDSLEPDRVVIGANNQETIDRLTKLHQPFNAPIIVVSPDSAQMGKYTANAYLATRITFINQIADLCDKNGADIDQVIQVISPDHRIGPHYWYPGFGYGGSCFPKDVKELAAYAKQTGLDHNLLVELNRLNEERIPKLLRRFSEQIDGWDDKQVAVLGLAFKPHTNDMREAPSIKTIEYLLNEGAIVTGYDPEALKTAQTALPSHDKLTFSKSINEAVTQADVVLALIEWPQIVEFDFTQTKLNKPQWFIDARNQFNASELREAGYEYLGIGK